MCRAIRDSEAVELWLYFPGADNCVLQRLVSMLQERLVRFRIALQARDNSEEMTVKTAGKERDGGVRLDLVV